MKNMKKSILGVAMIALVLIITMIGSVNAASVSASQATVKKGDVVTVTINTKEAVQVVEFELKYDASKFEYLGATTTLGEPTVNARDGVVNFVATNAQNTTNQVAVQFKAIDNTQGAEFVVSDFLAGENGEALDNKAVTVVVKEEEKQPENPTEPTNPSKPSNPTNPSETQKPAENGNNQNAGTQENAQKETKTQEKIGTDGKVITKLPQTGTPVFIGVIAFITIAGVVLAIRKAK